MAADLQSNEAYKEPLGFHFRPTDEQIISKYLEPKILGQKLPSDVVEEVPLYSNDPWVVLHDKRQWDISEINQDGQVTKKTVYIFTPLTKKANAAKSARKKHADDRKEQYIRVAGCGTWDAQTGPTEILNSKGEVIGFKRMLVFEADTTSTNNNVASVHGHWIMHEYCLNKEDSDSDYVLCEITRCMKKKLKRKNVAQGNKRTSKVKKRSSHDEQPAGDTGLGFDRPLALQRPGGPIRNLDIDGRTLDDDLDSTDPAWRFNN